MVLNKIALTFLLLSACVSNTLLANEYTVAVRAHSGIDAAIQKWQPTIDLLNVKIPEHQFRLLPIISLNEISTKAGSRDFDFLLTNPSSYVEVSKLYGVSAIATLNNKRSNTAQNSFGSVIFTHARNSDILNINDLRDKTLMIVSEPAFGGWRVAWLEMLKQGFEPYKDLKKLTTSSNGTQNEVVLAVLNGDVDAGVVRTDLLERMEKKGIIDMRYLRIINNKNVEYFPFFLSTKLYPEWAFSSLSQVPIDHKQQVKSALLSITPKSEAAVTGNYISWLEPSNYTSVESLMKKLKVGPYSNGSKE